MQAAKNARNRKNAANLSINADLLTQARELKINLSATLEQALVEAIKRREWERWRAENKAAIEAYNAHVDEHGAFSDRLRSVLMLQFIVYRSPNPATQYLLPRRIARQPSSLSPVTALREASAVPKRLTDYVPPRGPMMKIGSSKPDAAAAKNACYRHCYR